MLTNEDIYSTKLLSQKGKKKKKKNRCKFPFCQKITHMLKVTKRQSLFPP